MKNTLKFCVKNAIKNKPMDNKNILINNLILDDWQEEALKHKGDLLLCTGRQIGKTMIMSLKAAKRMIEKELKSL